MCLSELNKTWFQWGVGWRGRLKSLFCSGCPLVSIHMWHKYLYTMLILGILSKYLFPFFVATQTRHLATRPRVFFPIKPPFSYHDYFLGALHGKCVHLVTSGGKLLPHGFCPPGIPSSLWNQRSHFRGSSFHGHTWPTKWAITQLFKDTAAPPSHVCINATMKGVYSGPSRGI